MEININFVLLEELREKPDDGAETRIVVIRQSKDVDSGLDSSAPDLDLPQ